MSASTSAVRIAPSVLSADLGRLAESVAQVEAAGADLIHVDVMDGHFVPNLTFGPAIVAALRRATRLPLDVHLMVDDPSRWVGPYRDAGADWLTIHAEADRHLQRTLSDIRRRGARAGVSLNPATSTSALEWVTDDVDLVLVMSVNPGFGGQGFIPAMLRKIRDVRDLFVGRPDVDVSVDGGVGPSNAASLVAAGASILVAGTAVFGVADQAQAIRSLRG
jgi:ribulose-phosphate 3-epimerase